MKLVVIEGRRIRIPMHAAHARLHILMLSVPITRHRWGRSVIRDSKLILYSILRRERRRRRFLNEEGSFWSRDMRCLDHGRTAEVVDVVRGGSCDRGTREVVDLRLL